MIYGYIRISTDKQTKDNQRFEIQKFADNKQLSIDRWIDETISSSETLSKRKLGNLLKKLKPDDMLIATELSRLGRNLFEVMSILSHCLKKGCAIWTIKDNYRLGADIQSKVLAFAFSLSAEIERNLISARTKEALERVKSTGKKLGRPTGRKSRCKLAGSENLIWDMMRRGCSKSRIAKELKVDRLTLTRFMQSVGQTTPDP